MCIQISGWMRSNNAFPDLICCIKCHGFNAIFSPARRPCCVGKRFCKGEKDYGKAMGKII